MSRDFEKKFLYFKNNGRCASYTSSTAKAVPLPLEGKAGVLLNPLGFPFEGKLPEGVMRCSLRSKRYPYDSSCANNGHCVSYTSFERLRRPLSPQGESSLLATYVAPIVKTMPFMTAHVKPIVKTEVTMTDRRFDSTALPLFACSRRAAYA